MDVLQESHEDTGNIKTQEDVKLHCQRRKETNVVLRRKKTDFCDNVVTQCYPVHPMFQSEWILTFQAFLLLVAPSSE